MAPSHGMENFDHSIDQTKEKKELLYGENQKRIYPLNRITVEAQRKLVSKAEGQEDQIKVIENNVT